MALRLQGRGNLAAIDEVFVSNHVIRLNDMSPKDQNRAPDPLKEWIPRIRDASPDLKVTVEELLAEGDRATF